MLIAQVGIACDKISEDLSNIQYNEKDSRDDARPSIGRGLRRIQGW